jgi:16S rRNA (cytosine967-C5)-methyltransferase
MPLRAVPHPARKLAAKAVFFCRDGRRLAHEVLHELQEGRPLPPADVAFATEITLGTLRRLITCEHLASRFYRGRWAGLSPALRSLLATAVYQLCWLERVPDHAVVDETVRLAKSHGAGATATVNAVLRAIAAARGELLDRPVDASPRRYLPIDAIRGRLFARDVFPDPDRRPLEYLIAVTGHPPWLVERWHRRFKPTRCRQICEAGMTRPKLVLRPNPLRITAPRLAARLQHDGLTITLDDESDAVFVDDHPAVTLIDAFREGLCQPQDTTARMPVRLAEPRSGECLLDLCAGVGTKATQAAEWMNDAGLVIASDVDETKLARVAENAVRLGLRSLRTVPSDALEDTIEELGRKPNVVLVDAPCSNTGVLARRPEARFRAFQKNLLALVALQREILATASRLAGPTTRLVYSTCSLEREENEEQVTWFLQTYPGWRLQRDIFTLPEATRDGGYCALLVQ